MKEMGVYIPLMEPYSSIFQVPSSFLYLENVPIFVLQFFQPLPHEGCRNSPINVSSKSFNLFNNSFKFQRKLLFLFSCPKIGTSLEIL